MNRLAIGAAMLALVGASALSAAEPALPKGGYRAPWYKRLFGIGPEPPKVVPSPPRDPAKVAAAERARAEADLDRRLRVCDQLRQIAYETQNDQLAARADDLERQACELYKQQTAHLPCSRLVPMTDDRALDRQLDLDSPTVAADKLTTPAISIPSRKAQASAIREVKP